MNPDLVIVECPKCHLKISKRRLRRHLKRDHNPEVELARKQAALAESRNKIEGEKNIKCPICSCLIKSKNLVRHGKLKHKLFLSQISGINKFKSNREKESFWKSKLGPDIEDESNDVFSKGVVISGGAYGLGKNRKN